MPDGKKKIFLSWSKSQSKAVALVLKKYLLEILEGVEIFVSDKDIDPGERSMKVLERELEDTTYGIAVVTAQNQSEPWLNFESGALSKAVGNDAEGTPYVVPLLVDIEKGQLTGPISQFQAVPLNREGLAEIVRAISDIVGTDKEIADRRYKRAWEDMNNELEVARRRPAGATKPFRHTDDKIDEILEISRFLQRSLPVAGVNIPRFVRQEPSRREVTDQLRQVESVLAELGAELLDYRINSYGISEINVFTDDDPQFFRDNNLPILDRKLPPRIMARVQFSSSPKTVVYSTYTGTPQAGDRGYAFESGGVLYEVKRPPRKATATPSEEDAHTEEDQAGDDHAT